MECVNQTFVFNQSHFATPVSADFGYADVTFTTTNQSPIRHHTPLSPSSRSQRTPPPLSPPQPLTPSTRYPQNSLPKSPKTPASPPKTSPQPSSIDQPSHEDLNPSELPASSPQEHAEGVPNRSPKTVQEVVQPDDLAVKKKRADRDLGGEESEGEEEEEEEEEESSRVMGDSKENRSPGTRAGGGSNSNSSSCGTEDLQVLSLRDHYEVERELGRGTYGKVVLARCRHTGTRVALKLLPKTSTKLREFLREFQLSYFLSPHASIVDTYNVAFQTKSSYVFAQEHAPLGDLFDAIPPQLGMREADAKSVIKQLASALDFMHSKHLVHRDIKPENVLVMAADFSRVKLLDFGMTRKHGSMVRKTSGSIPYTPPEVCEAVRNENIHISKSADVWALAVLLFCMLTGNFPWENADIGDMYYNEFVLWQRRKTTKLPSQWRRFTPRAMKLFRKTLEIKPERRCGVGEVYKYMADAWTQKARVNDSEEESGSSASGGHMDELATMLKDHGIDTHVDRRLRERRISEWLLSL